MHNRRDMNRYLVALAVALTWSVAGCGPVVEDGETNQEQPPVVDLEAEACEHMVEAADRTVMGAASFDESLSPINAEHVRVDVALPAPEEGSTESTGYVSYEAADAGRAVFFLSEDVPLDVATAAGATVMVSRSVVEACEQVAVRYEAPVEAGTSYVVSLGPTSTQTVGVVSELEGE